MWGHWLCTSERAIIQHAKFIVHLRRQRSFNERNKQRQESLQCVMFHAHIVLIWIGFMTASIKTRWFRSTYVNTTQHLADILIKGSFAGNRWTQPTLGEHHDPHNIYPRQFVSFFCRCESFTFQHELNVPENLSPHRLAPSKKPVHCPAKTARNFEIKMPTWTFTQYFPVKYQAGGESKREDLCQQDSGRVIRTTTGVSSPREKNVHLHPNTDGEKYIRKFDDLATNFKQQMNIPGRVFVPNWCTRPWGWNFTSAPNGIIGPSNGELNRR